MTLVDSSVRIDYSCGTSTPQTIDTKPHQP